MRALVLLSLLLSAPVFAAERYHLKLAGVEPVSGVPPEVAAKVGALLEKLTKDRPEFVAELTGAPADPDKLRKWLAGKKIKAFSVTAKITIWERSLEPAKEGKSGQILKLRVEMQLLGEAIPGGVLALTGEGGSTVMVEIGKTVRPRDDEYAADQALTEATSHALDEAVRRLRAVKKGK
jgi:hypothetical protein